MATLPTLRAASPLDASDDNRLTFTLDVTETLTRALDDVPVDFASMDALSWRMEASLSGATTDDTYELQVRIVSGATILAAADAGGTFVNVVTNPPATDTFYGTPTAFAYVNTAASRTDWNNATVELRQNYFKNMAADAVSLRVDVVEFTGTYTSSVTVVPVDGVASAASGASGALGRDIQVLSTSAASSDASAEMLVIKKLTGSSSSSSDASALLGLKQPNSVRVSFPCPDHYLTSEAQEFRVLVRKQGSGPDPTVIVELWEKGSFLAQVVASTQVTSTTGVVVSGTWNASLLANNSGHDVECRVVGEGYDNGSIEIGAIEWNANIDSTTNRLLCGYSTPTASGAFGSLTVGGEPPALFGSSSSALSAAAGTLAVRRLVLGSSSSASSAEGTLGAVRGVDAGSNSSSLSDAALTVISGPMTAVAANAATVRGSLQILVSATVVRTRTFFEQYRDTGWEDWR